MKRWRGGIVGVFCGVGAGEGGVLKFQVAPLRPERRGTKRDMRRVLPVVSDRCVWVVHCRRAMHECWRTECRLTWITEIDVRAEIVLEFLRKAERKFVEEIVRMLAVVQCLSVPHFAGLKQKRITTSTFSERIEAHH